MTNKINLIFVDNDCIIVTDNASLFFVWLVVAKIIVPNKNVNSINKNENIINKNFSKKLYK